VTADLVLAIDQGTSSTRAIAYDRSWAVRASAGRPLATRHPRPGWAEQDPGVILDSVVAVVAEVVAAVGGAGAIGAVGMANQGETVVPWDSTTGEPLGPAIVWHCKRSQPIVDQVAAAGHEPAIRALTGLPLDPYFSASKMRWLIEHEPGVARAAEERRLAVGTVDAWLTARLAGAARTDPSTASRTQLFGLQSLGWEDRLAGWWDVPREALPVVGPSWGDLGELRHPDWGALPLRAMLCDQQAALLGHGGHRPGTIKATYGTGVFVLANAGPTVPSAPAGLLATVAWGDGAGRATYALDGGVFSAGALLDWLSGGLGLIGPPAELDRIAGMVEDDGGIRILPALAGLGAPWWDPDARAVIAGLTPATTPGHIARAAIDAIAQRTADVVEAMTGSLPPTSVPLRVDGGLSASRTLIQRQADLLGRPIEVAAAAESTALGVGLAAAIGSGSLTEDDAIAVAGVARRIEPALPERERRAARSGWTRFVRRAVALDRADDGDDSNDPIGTTAKHVEGALER
jgi:glycerol kinase